MEYGNYAVRVNNEKLSEILDDDARIIYPLVEDALQDFRSTDQYHKTFMFEIVKLTWDTTIELEETPLQTIRKKVRTVTGEVVSTVFNRKALEIQI